MGDAGPGDLRVSHLARKNLPLHDTALGRPPVPYTKSKNFANIMGDCSHTTAKQHINLILSNCSRHCQSFLVISGLHFFFFTLAVPD